MYPLTTAIQYLLRKHKDRGFGRMGQWTQHRRDDGDEPETRNGTTLLAGTKGDLV